MTTSGLLETPATREEKINTLFSAGIWLLFLGWTVYGFIISDAPVYWQVAGWVALPSFVVIYLYSFLHPEPLTGLPRFANTLAYTVVLVGLGFVMMMSTLYAVVNMVPFLMALWLFSSRLRTGLAAVALIAVVVTSLAVALQLEAYESWLLSAIGIPTVILVMVRISIELEERQRVNSERLALAEQREDLAGTVHDLLGHSLTTVTVKTQLARRLLRVDPEAAERELDDVLALSRRSLSEVRATVTDLRQPDLLEQLDQAEQSLCAAGIELRRPEQLPALTLMQQQVVAWVLRETVTNVIRHSEAQRCTVCVVDGDDVGQVIVRIDDDGVGLPAECADAGAGTGAGAAGTGTGTGTGAIGEHHGLLGMRRRVEAVGGTLRLVDLEPGTRVEARL